MRQPIRSGWVFIERVETPDGTVYEAEAEQLPSGTERLVRWRVLQFDPAYAPHVVREGKEKNRDAAWEKARAVLKEGATGKL